MYFWKLSLHHPMLWIAPFRIQPCQAPAPTQPCHSTNQGATTCLY
uniref:Uncharacterized protein n=1 Tax=Anguilla anguilla TaxID=7936 RepID=A0A0E9PW66_ANGAN